MNVFDSLFLDEEIKNITKPKINRKLNMEKE